MRVEVDETARRATAEIETYADLLAVRAVPEFRWVGRATAEFDAAHLDAIGRAAAAVDEPGPPLADCLFDYQAWIVERAVGRRRLAVFAQTGLGKTLMELEWARQVLARDPGRVLVVAPLNVVAQTIREAAKFYGGKLPIEALDSRADLDGWLARGDGLAITNFEKLDGTTSPLPVSGFVIDESSALKQSAGSRRTSLIAAGKGLRWKLCGSATPAPNDRVEYAEHAYFLDVVRSTREFLAAYFVNRDGEWQLKAHGRAAFYRHLASWSVFMSDPKAYRFADHLSSLPPMRVERIPVGLTIEQAEAARRWEKGSQSSLFGATPGGIVSRTKVTQIANGFELTDSGIVRYPANKPVEVARLCNETHAGEQVIVWVTHDAEGDQLAAMIPDGVHVSGRTARSRRDRIIEMFAAADPEAPRVLIAKTAMFGFGLNLQAASVQVWSSVSDSWERWWQAIRRSWRYGQERPVTIYVPLTPLDEAIHQNVMAKEATFLADAAAQEAAFVEVLRPRDTTERRAMVTSPQAEMAREGGESWQAVQADCVAHMATMAEASMDLAVFSPPFANLFTYSSEAGDMGNVRSDGEYRLQWEFFAAELLRVMRPGRVCAVHCMDVIRFAGQHGHRHTYDYPSDLRAGMERAGFTYHARIAVDKNPQVQAVRTKNANLLFATLKRDALDSHPQASECVLVFRKPGEPDVPVHAIDVSNREWIRWAHHVWYDIRETDVLNAALAKEHEDERHICALQLGLIERCVRLWTNPGETVFDPFAGIGSTGWEALAWGRRFYGIELKESYFRTACRFLADREAQLSGRLDLGGHEAPSAPL